VSYAFKITGLANKKELIEQADQDYRLYKFALNDAPDGFWVLIFQQVGRDYREVTLSGNDGQAELWATASPNLSVKHVLRTAQRAVTQANAEANEANARFNKDEQEKAAREAAAQARLAAELDELNFDEPGLDEPIVPAEPDERTEPMMVAEGGPPLTPEEANSLFKMTPEGEAAAAESNGESSGESNGESSGDEPADEGPSEP
jgi:hypothetical protein